LSSNVNNVKPDPFQEQREMLRHFGASRKRAVEAYIQFAEANLGEKSQDDCYRAAEGRLLEGKRILK